MTDNEYRTIKARMAYEKYKNSLPKCDECRACAVLLGRNGEVRACGRERRMIDGRVQTSPEWCPKRPDNRFGG